MLIKDAPRKAPLDKIASIALFTAAASDKPDLERQSDVKQTDLKWRHAKAVKSIGSPRCFSRRLNAAARSNVGTAQTPSQVRQKTRLAFCNFRKLLNHSIAIAGVIKHTRSCYVYMHVRLWTYFLLLACRSARSPLITDSISPSTRINNYSIYMKVGCTSVRQTVRLTDSAGMKGLTHYTKTSIIFDETEEKNLEYRKKSIFSGSLKENEAHILYIVQSAFLSDGISRKISFFQMSVFNSPYWEGFFKDKTSFCLWQFNYRFSGVSEIRRKPWKTLFVLVSGVVMRDKRHHGALSKVQKLKKRLSQSFGKLGKTQKTIYIHFRRDLLFKRRKVFFLP